MRDAKKCKDYDALCKVIRENKYLSPERRGELLRAVHHVPRAKRSIEENELQEWMQLHQHPKVYMGAIGGHITKTECYTSIGTIESYFCSVCGEDCYVDTHL
jgi:hypothetical protein